MWVKAGKKSNRFFEIILNCNQWEYVRPNIQTMKLLFYTHSMLGGERRFKRNTLSHVFTTLLRRSFRLDYDWPKAYGSRKKFSCMYTNETSKVNIRKLQKLKFHIWMGTFSQGKKLIKNFVLFCRGSRSRVTTAV